VTLTELLIVIAIVAVLVGLAVPNLREFFVANRLDSASNEILAALSTARSEAIRRGIAVTLCRTDASNANGCSTDGSRNWSNGWTVCVDDVDNTGNPRGRCKTPLATNTIRVGNAIPLPLTLYSNALPSVLPSTITFDAGGRVLTTLLGYSGVYVVCHQLSNNGWGFSESGRSRSRAVLVNLAGRIRLAVDSDGNGVPNGDAGTDITGTCTAPVG